MIKVIVTGGTGFIGKNLLPILASKTAQFYILSIDDCESEYNNIRFIKCNLLDMAETRQKLSSIKASHLMHLAWGISPSNYNLPVNFDWIKASINLIEAFKDYGGIRMLIAGTGVEYDWKYSNCIEDVTPTSNESLYGASKNILRQFAFKYCEEFGIDIIWPRLFFLYGPYEHPQRLFSHIIISLLNNKEAVINNGGIYRDYLYIKDTTRILTELLFSDFKGIINVSSGIPVSLGNIGEMIAKYIGKTELLKIYYPKVIAKKVVFADTFLLNELELFPEYDISNGIKETINWWRKNNYE